MDFFVSYTQADLAWAEWIAWQLEENGLSTTIQAWDFRPGCNFILEMNKAVERAQRTIAVLSESYVEAAYTHPEWAGALARDPVGEDGVLLPIRVREFKPKGLLAQVVYLDLVGLTEDKARDRLLRHVTGRRAKPQIAPRFAGKATEPWFDGPSGPGNDTCECTPTGEAGCTATTPGTRDEVSLVSKAEQDLMPYVGPVAKVLVRRAAPAAKTPAELYAALAISIPRADERQAFLLRQSGRSGKASIAAPLSEPASPSSGSGAFAPTLLERLSQELALYLGPLARFTLDRELSNAATVEDLYQRLCRHLPVEAERLAFLGRLPKAS